MKEKVLILSVDRDNDIYEKAGLNGPFVGREENIKAATKLAIADPEDADANAIFYAVKLYDTLKKKEYVEVATLTGHKTLGYRADKEISKQLDRIVKEYHIRSVVFVSDGTADEETLPIIRSRVPIASVKIVFVKQAKELEKTYFVLLEKLKDPHYSKIMLGIPAILILMITLSTQLGLGWQPIGLAIGLYLLIKGFGIEDVLLRMFSGISISLEKPGWVVYVAAVLLLLFSLFVAYSSYFVGIESGLSGLKLFSHIIRSVIFLVAFATILIIIGRAIDDILTKKTYLVPDHAIHTIGTVVVSFVLISASSWILNYSEPYVDFEGFLSSIFIGVVVCYLSVYGLKKIRKSMLLSIGLEGKEVVSDGGSYIGRIVGVEPKKGTIIVTTQALSRFETPLDNVLFVSDRVVVKE